MRNVTVKAILFFVVLALSIAFVACGGSDDGDTSGGAAVDPDADNAEFDSIYNKFVIISFQTAVDGSRVENITLRPRVEVAGPSEDRTMRVAKSVDQTVWTPEVLQDWINKGKLLGIKVGVTYIEKSRTELVILDLGGN